MRTTWPVLTSAIAIGALAAASAAPRRADVEPLMARFLADSNVVGVSVGVERGGEVIVRGGWGLADRGTGRKATAETAYRLGSSSKQFTAALVMRLVERGVVGLDDPVDRHLPQMPRKWLGITVRQLLNHTSGVPDFTDTGSSNWAKKLSPEGLLALVSGHGLQSPAGSTFAYSNSNYVMLGQIAERHYGKPLPQILSDELFGPLNMTSTRYCEDEYGANGQAMPYMRNGDRIEDAPYWSVAHGFGSGGICSTVADVAVWTRALHGGKVVSASSYAQMTTPEGAAASQRFGFGLMTQSVAGRPALLHGGTVPGFVAMPAWLPAEQLSIVILMNTRPTPHTPFLLRDLARLALGDPVTIVPIQTGPPPDPAALRPLAGTYIIDVPSQPLEIRFWVDGTTLMSKAWGQDRIPLRPAGPHAFGAASDWSVRYAFNVVNGAATGLTFEKGGSTFTGLRKR
jgi:CubicO group peptidase (beta-lactamase class C family)